MTQDDIPKTLLAKHPELVQIDEAIRAHQAGKSIEARCPTCDQLLVVEEVPVTGDYGSFAVMDALPITSTTNDDDDELENSDVFRTARTLVGWPNLIASIHVDDKSQSNQPEPH